MKLSRIYVLSVPYAAGLACFGGPVVAGYRATGWVFAVMLAAAPLVVLLDRTPSRFPIQIWLPWVLIVVLSLFWTTELGRRNLQDVCQILTPFVIAPIASKALKTIEDLKALLKSFSHCLLILLAGLVLKWAIGIFILERPMAMTAAIVGCVFVAQIRERQLLAVFGWFGCLLIAAVTGSRMATLALLLEWMILPRYRRQLARVVVVGLIATLAVLLFYSPVFQARFFGEDQGTLTDIRKGDFSSAGRFEVWAELWKEIGRRPLLGAGAHGSAEIVNRLWYGIDKPHNDYLRILLEQGVVGLSFFVFGIIWQLVSLWIRRFSGNNQLAVIRSAAYVGIFVFLIMAMTDNPLIYGVWFTHPLFVLIGASYSQVSPVPTDSWQVTRPADRARHVDG